MIAASTELEAEASAASPLSSSPSAQDSDAPLRAEPLAEQISFDEFAKVDFRVARIVAAEDVPGEEAPEADAESRRRPTPQRLRRHQARLPTRAVGRPAGHLRGEPGAEEDEVGTSDGMIVAAGGGENEIFLLAPDEVRKPGKRVH